MVGGVRESPGCPRAERRQPWRHRRHRAPSRPVATAASSCGQVFRRADVGPRTPESLAGNPAVGYPPLEVRKQFELRPTRKFVKQTRFVDADARVRVTRRAVERDPSVDEGEIASGMVGRVRDQHEVGARIRCIARHRLGPPAERSVVERRIDVAGDDQCRSRRQERQRRGDAAGHFQRLRLERPAQRHAVALAPSPSAATNCPRR